MNKMRIRKLITFLLVMVIALSNMPRTDGKEQANVIYISTKEELLEFAKQCRLDTWSVGKVVELTSDIDLEGESFSPIPIFSGVFDGKGHTISGIHIETSGSTQGLFRYIEPSGVIKDVTLKGNVLPRGTQSTVGGVAGSNAGMLQNVTFSGTVSGEDSVGGLVGVNLETGQVVMSTMEGKVFGEKMVGGVVGKNLGTVIDATNLAEVNTVVEETTNSMETVSFELEGALEQLSSTSNIDDSQQLLDRYTDIGGIVGYSSGIIQGATNKGEIGYPHVGYNVGGIAGRQSGYILGASNEGRVYGRKDVGGIVGHAEPNITLSLSEDILDRLEAELENLRQLVNATLNDVDSTSTETSNHLSSMSQYTSTATEQTQTLFNQTTDFVDANIEEINQVSRIIAHVIDKMNPIMVDIEKSSEHMTKGLDDLERAFEELEEAVDESEAVSEHIEKAMKDLRHANNSIYGAVRAIQVSMEEFKEAIVVNDEARVEEALQELSIAISQLSQEVQRSADAFESLGFILESITNAEDLMDQQEAVKIHLAELVASFEKMSILFFGIGDNINEISANTYLDWHQIQKGAQELEVMMDELQELSNDIDDALGHLIDGFEPMEDMTSALGKAMNRMSRGMEHMKEASDEVTNALEKVTEVVSDLSEEEPIVFTNLGEDYRTTSDQLYGTIESISNELDELNNSMTAHGQQLTQQITKINNQFNVIMGLLMEAVEQVIYFDETMSPLNRIEDFSDEDIEKTTWGKILESTNKGRIEADHNVGGIVGLMAIEYGINQELDLGLPNSLNYTYQTRAIIQACKNEGEIVGKKDYIGGIAGRMYTGVIIDSENYGLVKSTNGNYVGGVAGGSEALVHSSFSKNVLEGKNYIGGIVGIGKNVVDSYSNVQILSGEENIGAIAGGLIEEDTYVQHNYFISEKLGGIDQISYTNQAEPISYEELSAHEGVPERFLTFRVTTVVDEVVQEQIPVTFGELFETIQLPQLPEKEGYYGYWEPVEIQQITGDIVINGIYKPWVTMVASDTSEENELSFVLVEGQFKEDAVVKITEKTDLEWKQEDGERIPIHHIKLENTQLGDQEEVTIRLLNEQEKDVTVWRYKNNTWEIADTKRIGKYIATTMEGTEGIFCIVPKEERFVSLIIGSLLSMGIVMLVGSKVINILLTKLKSYYNF